MRKLFRKLFKPEIAWSFNKAELLESDRELDNPARGWYSIYPFFVEKEPDFTELSWCAESKETLALVIINIGAYKEMALDEVAMEHIRSILKFFTEHSYDIILRIVYDHEGKAVEREPFFFKQVKEHLGQITSLVGELSESVFIMQGMLVGNWGEMHSSRFLSADKLRQMWNILRDKLSDSVFYAVRRPSMWRMLHAGACGKAELPEDTMGLFDDAIFGSKTHLGTFAADDNVTSSNGCWDGLWSRAEELLFEEKLCRKVPNGGEAVCGENYAAEFTPHTTVEVLKQMHVTYLNQAHDENIIKLWKDWTWEEAGDCWSNCNFYDYVGRHLGYRFLVKDVSVEEVSERQQLQVMITVENTGFANCYQEAEVLLECEYSDGESVSYKHIECDVRAWNKVEKLSTIIDIKACQLYLTIRRKADGRTIYLANSNADERVFLGQIVV